MSRTPSSFVAYLALLIAVAFAPPTPAAAEEIGLIERYALASDRTEVLRSLIPGSEEYYFYHALHHQVTGDLERAEAVLGDWERAVRERRGLGESALLVAIRDRQRLMAYGASPDRTIEYLRHRLGLHWNHTAPPTPGQRQWPDALAGDLLEADRVIDEAVRNHQPLTQVGLARLADRFLADGAQGLPVNLEWLTQQIDGPWYPRLAELVIAELRARTRPQDRQFGDRAAHAHLTLDQLQSVAQAFPELRASDAMIREMLARLRPDADSDMHQQPDVRLAYLQRLNVYVQTLPEAHNSLKASALYRLLEAHWQRGEFPKDLFLRYLRLPRQSPIIYVDPRDGRPVADQRHAANLSQDFTDLAILPPIPTEEPLVRAYLEHFLKDAESTEEFEGLVRTDYLNRVFAETKLLYGVGEPERWFAMLSAEERRRLAETTELTLAVTNPHVGDPAQPATLAVDLKNVDELIVRVYEINTQAYYRTHNDTINTDIDLDGLVATAEHRQQYHLPAIRRHRERIELEGIEGRGVWVVDLLGGGLRARAVVRRGDLRVTEQLSVDGHVFTVLDENRQIVPEARMLVGGREWLAGDDGRIVVPPVDQSVTRQATVMDDDLAVPVLFHHRGESYELVARMMVNRQQLVAGRTARLVLRPRLTLFGQPIDPAMLEQATVTVTAVDHDGIETTRRFTDLELDQRKETVLEIRIPARVASLSATLSGEIATLATGRRVEVRDTKSWDVNGVDKTLYVYDVYLTRQGNDWIVEARGRNGEAIAGAGVQVALRTLYRHSPVEATLETDDSGRVVLGPLPGVVEVTLATGDGLRQTRDLTLADAVWPDTLHATSEEALRLPLPVPASDGDAEGGDAESVGGGGGEIAGMLDGRYRLLALRSGQAAEDVTGSGLHLEPGRLRIGPLEPGDYHLLDQREGTYRTTRIAVTAGPALGDLAAGQVRHLELAWPEPVSVAEVRFEDELLVVQLVGDASMARVHVLGGRYLPPNDPLEMPLRTPETRWIDLPENGYVSDLRLGDEILYVIRRQYADKFPGVMLPQPSLLIAPWVTDETVNTRQEAAEGDAIPPASDAAPPADAAAKAARGLAASDQAQLSQNLSFLARDGVVLDNLRPDEQGAIRIPLDQLGEAVVLRVVVVDPVATVERTVVRPLPEVESRDLRLAQPLNPQTPFTLQRDVLVAGPNQPLEMRSLGSAQVQLYTNVADLLQLYRTLSGDGRLDEFVPLGQWHTFDAEKKRELYGRLASHEMHIFLKAKDPEFFASVVRPYLENKKEKKLVDHWLLDRDLSAWTDLWQYAQLNAFEKALLARQVPGVRDAVIREMRERIALNPPDPTALRRLVEAGLAGKSLQEGVTWMRAVDGAEGRQALGLDMYSNDFSMAVPAPAAGFGGAAGEPALQFGDAFTEGEAVDEMRMLSREDVLRRYRGGRQAPARAYNQPAIPFFQHLDSTKQWAENHWDQVRVTNSNEALIPIDPFWLAWAEADANAAFLTEHLLRPSANRHTALVALALLDLPLEAQEIELPEDPAGTFQPPRMVAIVSKRLQSLEPMEGDASLLVGQRFEAANAPTPDPNDDREIKIAPDEFLAGVAYRGQIVLTNPTPQPRTVDVLWQIPEGSLPLAGSQATDSRTLRIEPFEVQRITYEFYFPASGSFVHYPVCISSEGTVLARASERTFQVVDTPTRIDEESWDQIARNGSPEKIQQFLETANLRRLNWSLVAHRMRDRQVYDVVIGVLDQARLPYDELWAYALFHKDQPRMKSYLETRADLVASVGPVLESPLMRVQPIARGMYEHLEYAPLVRARIHRLGEENEILNDRFLHQYRSLMRVIAYQQETRPEQDLALCYYLLLQNRIGEAIARFERLEGQGAGDADGNEPEASSGELRLQRDYMRAYLALHRADLDSAAEVAQRYLDHPVPRWRQRFAELAAQLEQRQDLMGGARLVQSDAPREIDSTPGVRVDAADLAVIDRERRQEQGAASTPDVRVRVEGDRLVIDHRNTNQATIRFYGVDLELLFSKTPFVRSGLDHMAMVRPGRIEEITLGEADGTAEFALDEELARQTLLVEVVSGSARDTALYYGGRLRTYVSEGFGQLQVSDRATGHPVATAYVKVYARGADGHVRFYKDGYTDLRGRFDYLTLSTDDLGAVQQLAILVLDPERGATLHEVAPPTPRP